MTELSHFVFPWVTYYGHSMTRVFVPGDRLKLERVSLESLCPGDVIAVLSVPVPFCHRVVAREGASVVTQGDNNAHPDVRRVIAGDDVCRVIAAETFHGKKRCFHVGRRGLFDFHLHQLQLKSRVVLSSYLRRLEAVFFWRLTPKDLRHFGNTSCLYWHGMPVFRVSPGGSMAYIRMWQWLFFRRPSAEQLDRNCKEPDKN